MSESKQLHSFAIATNKLQENNYSIADTVHMLGKFL